MAGTDDRTKQDAAVLHESSAMIFRLVGLGAEEGVARETLARIKSQSDWCPQFVAVAERYEALAEAAKTEYARIFYYMQATAYYHIAEMTLYQTSPEKKQAHSRMVDAYAKARVDFAYPTEDVLIPFAGGQLKGYFRHLRGIEKAPCVILVRGADACREIELHALSTALLDQGLFTLAVDLPGQGDQRFGGMKMTADFEKSVSAVVDYLETRSDVDADRIGIWGMSFGGFIAPKAAALEPRIKACVSLSGFFDLSEFELPLSAKLNCMANMKFADEEQWLEGRKAYTLEDVISGLPSPLLVVAGADDWIIPIANSVKIHDMDPGEKTLKVYDNAGHCVFYHRPEVLPYISGWLKDQLRPDRP
jgi:2,6-dihydroxypseudooxynicotine hydrolase